MRNTGVVRTYGQYCPIARGAEIFAERWTPLIIRNLYLGCGCFSEILEGAPGLSRTLLSERLKQLERLGVVKSAPKPDGRGRHSSSRLRATTSSRSAGRSASGVRVGSRSPPRTSTPLWRCGRCATRSAETGSRIDASSSASTSLPTTGRPRRERYWLLIELGDTEICKTYPGFDEDLYITADAEAFVKWHAGQLTWAQATREGRIQLDGFPSLVRAFPTWNARSMFAHIKPVSRAATSAAG